MNKQEQIKSGKHKKYVDEFDKLFGRKCSGRIKNKFNNKLSKNK